MAYSTLNPVDEIVAFTAKWTLTGEESLTKFETAVLRATGYIDYPDDHVLSDADIAAINKHEPAKPAVDWSAPFHMPKFNEAEYIKAKAEYNAKYGYAITVPAMSDIFHFGKPAPMTPLERYEWKQKNWDHFSDERLAELEKDKLYKKDRMLAMLASPTPELWSKLGAILTALDDAQDAVSTIGMLARLSRKIAPKAFAKLLSGPLGALLTVNDILNLITGVGTIGTFAGYGKRTKDFVTGANPFTKKARLKRKIKMGSWKPTFGDIIQAAQTTDQIFGVGVSLGPIVGFAQDVFHGAVKSALGKKVTMKFSPHSVPYWVQRSYNTIKSAPAYLSRIWNSPDEDILMIMQMQAMAQEVIMPYQAEWNPFDVVNNIEDALIRCPIPTHPTTLAAMHDLGMNVQDVIGWPDIDKVWASPIEIAEAYEPAVTATLRKFIGRHNHDSMGFLAASISADSAMYQMANIVGGENVEVDYTVASKLASALLMARIIPLPEDQQDPWVLGRVIRFIEQREKENDPIKAEFFYNWASYRGYQFYPRQ